MDRKKKKHILDQAEAPVGQWNLDGLTQEPNRKRQDKRRVRRAKKAGAVSRLKAFLGRIRRKQRRKEVSKSAQGRVQLYRNQTSCKLWEDFSDELPVQWYEMEEEDFPELGGLHDPLSAGKKKDGLN